MSAGRSPLSLVFLLHIALESPFVIQGLLTPKAMPIMELTNSTLVLIRLFATMSLATCVAAIMCFTLAEYLPGKRAVGFSLLVYHTIAASILFQAPRIIPRSFGLLAETLKATPENVWAAGHAVVGLGFLAWWQGTLVHARAAQQYQQQQQQQGSAQ